MNIGSILRRVVSGFGRKGTRTRPMGPTTTTPHRRTSPEAQAAKGVARAASKKL